MRKKMDNKGFSLVELIIVIAIMAVLVGVLAPQFMKYVEQSRRATDIQNAEMIRDSILADIADGTLKGSDTGATFNDYPSPAPATATPATGTVYASAIAEAPTVQGNLVSGAVFKVDWNSTNGTCAVKVGTYTLTDATSAASYKTATAP